MRFDRPPTGPRRTSLFVDHGDLRLAFEGMKNAPSTALFAERLAGFADTLGRVSVRAVYADWSEAAGDARTYRARGIEPRYVPTLEEDDNPADLVMSLDALQHALEVPSVTCVVIATSDPGLREVLIRLRALGRETILVGPESETSPDLARAADRFLSVEDLLARKWGASRVEDPAPAYAGGNGGPAATALEPFDPKTYDWSKFIRLMAELEDRLAFVGLKYLNQKVLNRHNCGFDDRGRRQDLINFSIDDGVIETYQVDNIGRNADPVSACRLNRDHEIVKANLPEGAPAPSPDSDPEDDEPTADAETTESTESAT